MNKRSQSDRRCSKKIRIRRALKVVCPDQGIVDGQTVVSYYIIEKKERELYNPLTLFVFATLMLELLLTVYGRVRRIVSRKHIVCYHTRLHLKLGHVIYQLSIIGRDMSKIYFYY